jgi:hypothetical protein
MMSFQKGCPGTDAMTLLTTSRCSLYSLCSTRSAPASHGSLGRKHCTSKSRYMPPNACSRNGRSASPAHTQDTWSQIARHSSARVYMCCWTCPAPTFLGNGVTKAISADAMQACTQDECMSSWTAAHCRDIFMPGDMIFWTTGTVYGAYCSSQRRLHIYTA